MATRSVNTKMRIYHRYLGFFLAGIMAVYAISGIILIFRDTNFLKRKKTVVVKLAPHLPIEEVGKSIRLRDLKARSENGDTVFFAQGAYNKATGDTKYTVTSLPFLVEKLNRLHKANSKSPLFFLNIFFGVSLFFFVISSFWMFMPKTSIFRKGLYFTLAGIVLTLILLFV